MKGFRVAGGSMVGTDHLGPAQVLLGRSNQDAYAIAERSNYIVAVVCDGCGSERHSEVGAGLAAGLLVRSLETVAGCYGGVPAEDVRERLQESLQRVKLDVLEHLWRLAACMEGGPFRAVNDYFLFTVMGAIVAERWSAIFSCGDGLFHLNGQTVQLQPQEGNEPVYVFYNFTGSSLFNTDPSLLDFQIQRLVSTDTVERLLIASDGAAAFADVAQRQIPGRSERAGLLEQFFEARYFQNADAIRRRLALVNSRKAKVDPKKAELVFENGLLPDDTTLVAIRRMD